jgi:hypothetical protein
MEHAPDRHLPQQLSLLPTRDDLPLRFRLDERTRRRGLAHVAQIRALLAARAANVPTRSSSYAAGRQRPAA